MAEKPETLAVNGSPGVSPRSGVAPPKEHQFKKGQVGNPGGMPKGTVQVKKRTRNALIRYLRANPGLIDSVAASLAEEAKTRPETIVEIEGQSKTIRTVGGGWGTAQRIFWDRMDGLLTQQADLNVNVSFGKRFVDDEEPDAG